VEALSVAELPIRPLDHRDSIDSLTSLLHRAYARLGAMGLNFTAVDQSAQTTRERIAAGQCFVLDADGTLAGTVVVAGPFDVDKHPGTRRSPWFLRRDVAHLHQLAVEPSLQGQGHGDRLINTCEAWAHEHGFGALALDTAEPAEHLRRRYARQGFAEVDAMQWDGKRYRSLILVKPLQGDAPSVNDTEHRCALVRALWAHIQARDWAAMRAAFVDDAVTQWPITGETFNDADTIVRVNAEYPEGWSIHVLAIDALADGRVQSIVRVDHGEQSFFANSCFAFEGVLVKALTEYWTTAEARPGWRVGAL
jgi:GNAT superfamily N-acetyltransferase